jgi:K+-transporting ATPase ATPase A chain
MNALPLFEYIQLVVFFGLLIGLTPILGYYRSKVFTGSKHFMLPVLGWLKRTTYKFIGINPNEETNWKSYTFALIIFNFTGFTICQ